MPLAAKRFVRQMRFAADKLLMKRRASFFIRVSRARRKIPCILEMPRSVMRGASLPARFPQVGRIRALCVGTPRCLKSFPISVVQYYRARALGCCREYAVPLLGKHAYQTSGLALGPDCLGLSKRIHRAFLRESSNRIAKARKIYGIKKGRERDREREWKEG